MLDVLKIKNQKEKTQHQKSIFILKHCAGDGILTKQLIN